jgi:hypothetical protein
MAWMTVLSQTTWLKFSCLILNALESDPSNAAPEWQARSKEMGQGLVAAYPLEWLVRSVSVVDSLEGNAHDV